VTAKRRNGRTHKGPSWLREQAEAELAAKRDKAETQTKNDAQAALQELLVQLVSQNNRLKRLATFAADRCARVVETRADLKAEWERRVAAEARVAELERELETARAPRPTRAPRKTTAATN